MVAFYGRLPQLWASVQCAGGFAMEAFAETSLEDFQRLQAINATSCFLSCREAVRAFARNPGGAAGRLVNVAARPALQPPAGAGMVAYAISKAAVATLTMALGEELAGDGIWVNAVAPAIIDTAANRAAMPEADHSRWPSAADLAETIVFLASPSNRSTRGAVVPVFGRG